MAYVVVDGKDVEPGYGGVFKHIRRRLGVLAFGINQVDLPPGAAGREHDHTESGQEEVYLVLRGSGIMRVDGDEVPLEPGRYCSSPPRAPVSRSPALTVSRGSCWAPRGRPAGSPSSKAIRNARQLRDALVTVRHPRVRFSTLASKAGGGPGVAPDGGGDFGPG
jgi:hypothetical protein